MPRLNAPREIPYDFHVVKFDCFVWLYDESQRTYICSATPMIYVEALYWDGPEDEEPDNHPDPTYIGESTLALGKALDQVEKVPVECPFDMDEKEAWDVAREEANANCLI